MSSNTGQPLISIAMCTYNGERFLAAQIDSILNQTWKNLELVIVDDCSTDGTVAIAEERGQKDHRIRIYKNAQNLGINQNFSRALSLCQGELIAPCDQDDIWHHDKLMHLQNQLGDYVMAYCDSDLMNADGSPMNMRISDRLHMYQGNQPAVFAFWNCISGHAMLFKRTLLEQALPIPPVKFHDWWLAFWAATVGEIKYVDEALVQYRQHAGGQTDVSRQINRVEVGNRAELFKERCRWFSYLASVPSQDQAYLQTLSNLYQAQSKQWLSIELIRHLRLRANDLLYINKKKSFFRFALKHFWGLKAKAFFSPSKYQID